MTLDYLKAALEQAATRRGFCAPNPAVGAVVVKDGRIIGTGSHFEPGAAHAERVALAGLSGRDSEGASLYVTLEPCCHFGRTPPCTDLIIQHKIAAVYYGFLDPNPLMQGRGIERLHQAGIPCHFIEVPEINNFYHSYAYWQRTGKPFVTAKLALSLDGKIAGPQGEPQLISNHACKEFTHSHRQRADALLTTLKTIICDDPQMNVRRAGSIHAKPLFILDSQLDFPLTAQVRTTAKNITLLHKEDVPSAKIAALTEAGCLCVPIPEAPRGLDLEAVLHYIGQVGIHDLWIEAGGYLLESLVADRAVNRLLFYVAPQCLGSAAYTAFQSRQDFTAQAQRIEWYPSGNNVICDMHF